MTFKNFLKPNKQSNLEVFSVSPRLLPVNKTINFNLYINSSAREGVDRFVCIWKAGKAIQERDVLEISKKFGHIYIAEDQRTQFFKDLGDNQKLASKEKVEILKTAALEHLDSLFHNKDNIIQSESIKKCLAECEAATIGMMESIRNYDIFGLHDLIAELDYHDHYTLDHSINTGLYNMMLFREVNPNATQEQLKIAGLSGMFHDIGKIKLPNSIINATQDLQPEEYKKIKQHPVWGRDLLRKDGIDFQRNQLNIITSVVYEHHENYNGSGYPNGLKGEEINIFARMTSISDFFDAITTKRSYHIPLDPLDALGVIENTCGIKVDPYLFGRFKSRIVKDEKLDSTLFLPMDFDPCCPHSALNLKYEDEIPKAEKPQKENGDVIHYTWSGKTQLPKVS
ncbi:MAG: HD domain-containing phosphohydrolase [Bdellovibrionota bacterium]|nr:HD domain-containing phosphohydrolase [Bdellovibrionota bacterium]